MLILPTGRKVPFSRNICKIFAALNICWEMRRWFVLQLLKTPPASSTQTVSCADDEVFPFACAGWAFLHCFFPSSSLTCTVFVSSAPCRHMNHCFIAGAAKQLAPLLGQYACSIACKAGSPAEKTTAGSCVVPAVISGSIRSFQSLCAKPVFEKRNPGAGPEKASSGLCCFTLKI